MTKKYKNLKILFQFLSFLLTVAPILVYVIIGFLDGDVGTGEKVFLSFSIILGILLFLINIILKFHLRSPLFIMLLGIYVALENILTLIIIMSVGIVLDEFVITPLKNKYKQKYEINKEIDKRV